MKTLPDTVASHASERKESLMYRYLALILLLISVSAHTSDSLRVDNKVLTVGDSAVRVLQLMGQPTIRAFQDAQVGALPRNQLAPGELWQYERPGMTIIVTIVGGRVAKFETLYQ
jgi:uncharacterized protein YaeQ